MKTSTSKQPATPTGPTNRPASRRGFLITALALVALALAPLARAQGDQPVGQCSNSTLQGVYMSNSTGTLNGLPIAQVNRVVSDGMGSVTGTGTAVVNGVVSFPVITATYTVNSDCTGTLSSVPAGLSQNFAIKDNGSQVFFIVTAHPAGTATIAGEAVRVSRK